MVEYTGTGDPRRSIELLWGAGDRRRRGPKPKLSVDDIVRAAITVADAEGLAALSMRRVADELGVGAMSLYTYVPSKAELIDVMLDRVCAETAKPPVGPGADWRARLEQIARENWALHRRHPWILQVATSRPVLGPNLTEKYDYELRALEGLGLTDLEMDAVLALVVGYVQGAARTAVEADLAERSTGSTEQEWWAAYAPLLAEVFDPERFPVAARVGATVGEVYGAAVDPAVALEFGLARVLDGIAAFIRTR